MSEPTEQLNSNSSFPSTRWTLVVKANGEDEAARSALEQLCSIYWQPVYYFFLRENGQEKSDAEDLTQGFFFDFLSRKSFTQIDRDKGKFRSYLLKSAQNFLNNQRRRDATEKRGGSIDFISFDTMGQHEQTFDSTKVPLTPEQVFDRQWTRTLIDNVYKKLRHRYVATGREELFDRLQDYLQPKDSTSVPYSKVASDLGISENAVQTNVFRMKGHLRKLFREEVRETLGLDESIGDEMQYLFSTFH